jgi:endogenous inhibitor of DNA gyrase (YacG/DUF329 family)
MMKKPRCPICGKEMPGQYNEWPDYPFCSPKCRKIDLGRWLGEKYRVPADDQQPSESPKNGD